MSDRPNETCWFFVDDSNIWIEAQKAAAAGITHVPKLLDSDRDPRHRINIGKLVKTLCRGRLQGPSSLYGSRPPPNDSVWAQFERFDFDLHIFDRNLKNKEKEVDTEMASDLSEAATELRIGAKTDEAIAEKKANAVFVVISGDRDMIPAIKKVLKADIRVELWGWKSGMSRDYYKLASEFSGLLSVNHLEAEAANVFFTNMRSTRKGNPDPTATVVCCVDPPATINEDAFGWELLQLQRLFFTSMDKSRTVLYVEFPKVQPIDPMISRLRELFKNECRVLSYPEHAQSIRSAPIVLETRNMYAPLDQQGQPYDGKSPSPEPEASAPENTAAEEDPEDDGQGWETVRRSDPQKDHRRHQHQRQACPQGIRCSKGGDCGYQHQEHEKSIFRSNPGRDMRYWKTRQCIRVGCLRGKMCGFAHSKEEIWCLHCKVLGHGMDECPFCRK